VSELVAIAKIARPRGLKGEVIADILTDFPDRFNGLTDVTSVSPSGERRNLKIENVWFQNDRVVLKFDKVDSVEGAEQLRNTEICVDEAESVQLQSDEYYEWQLAGCRVETTGGEFVGTVREVMPTGGTENLVVENGDRDWLIPFAGTICVDVDIDNKRIVVDPPEGLLEF
jgi:16S rRNA processing protein RimM